MAHADEVIGLVGVDIAGRGAQGAGRNRCARIFAHADEPVGKVIDIFGRGTRGKVRCARQAAICAVGVGRALCAASIVPFFGDAVKGIVGKIDITPVAVGLFREQPRRIVGKRGQRAPRRAVADLGGGGAAEHIIGKRILQRAVDGDPAEKEKTALCT